MPVIHNYINQAVVLEVGNKCLTKALIKEIRTEMEKSLDGKIKHIIWNLESCTELSDDVYEDLYKVVEELKAQNIKLMIFTNNKISLEIENNGYKTRLPCFVSPKPDKTPPLNSNSEFFELIVESLLSTIKKLSEVDFKLEQIVVTQEEQPIPRDADVVGVIGMASRSFKGSLILAFDKTVILNLASKILGEEFTSLTPEVAGWAGEILNMTMGSVKGNVNSRGENLSFSIPNSFMGSSMNLVETRTHKSDVHVGKIEGSIGTFFVRFTQEEHLLKQK